MELAYDLHLPPGDKEQNLPPVILLHGMMDSRKTWGNIAPGIAKLTGRKVYTVDARNHGESPWDDDMSFDIIADDLHDFLDQHNIPKAVVVGHSMGGRTALTLALKRPERVEKIVVEDMNLRNFGPTHTGPITYLLNLLRDTIKEIPPGVDQHTARRTIAMEVAKTFMTNEQRRESAITKFDLNMIPVKEENGVYSWQTNLDAIEKLLTTDKIRQTLHGVYMGDALFLYGTKSFFKVDKDLLIPKYFPQAVRLGFEGATHLVHFEYPKRFIEEVCNFINSHNLPRSKY